MSPISPARRRVYLAITFALPLVILGIMEGLLLIGGYSDDRRAFDSPAHLRGLYRTPARRVASRYFPREQQPPAPPTDVFLIHKPENGLRLFVLGESAAGGFPYPPNGSFSRLLRDALRDVLPRDSVEVVNLGLAATNSYTMVDLAGDVLAQDPDGVLIYAGHNEYYGALGAGSTETLGSSPALVRLILRLQRIRTVALMRDAVSAIVARLSAQRIGVEPSASRMESVVRDQRIVLGSPTYERGIDQLESNLGVLVTRFLGAGVPVFVASVPSNLRDQPPFGSLATDSLPGADSIFREAARAYGRGDSASARALFERARDLDVVRFRAPKAFEQVIRDVAARLGAQYVPVTEAFAAAAPGGIPGSELFLEHVHPNQSGYALIGRTFFEALQEADFLGRTAEIDRLAPWPDYERRMAQTELDHRIAAHTVSTITVRWPFVPLDSQVDYRATYQPVSLLDSLAFHVSRGGAWDAAKGRLGRHLELTGEHRRAFLEYEGLVRELPYLGLPYTVAARPLLALGEVERAEALLAVGQALEPSAEAGLLLGTIAVRRGDALRAIRYLEQSLALRPNDPDVLFQLLLASAQMRDADRARAVALQLSRVAPNHPELGQWLRALGLVRR